jgi:hypothetical protein
VERGDSLVCLRFSEHGKLVTLGILAQWDRGGCVGARADRWKVRQEGHGFGGDGDECIAHLPCHSWGVVVILVVLVVLRLRPLPVVVIATRHCLQTRAA